MAFGDESLGSGIVAAGTRQKHEEGGEREVTLRRDRV